MKLGMILHGWDEGIYHVHLDNFHSIMSTMKIVLLLVAAFVCYTSAGKSSNNLLIDEGMGIMAFNQPSHGEAN